MDDQRGQVHRSGRGRGDQRIRQIRQERKIRQRRRRGRGLHRLP